MDTSTLERLARAWADGDPDPRTASEVRALLAQRDWTALEDRFGTALGFGTAGLRGALGGGPNRMNRAVVRRTTAGLARYLRTQGPDVGARGLVVGRDGRTMSAEFAADVAGVLAAEGIAVHVLPGLSPTPVTAFATTHLGAAGAVMVTASHNPREDNGYKVYWGNGAQIVPPHDAGIAKAIETVEPAKDVPVLSEAEARARGLWRDVPASVEQAYLDAVLALRPTKSAGDLSIVYTAMHGVGGRWVLEALRRAGFAAVHPVPEQQEPDGAFPTVRFPNPEEPGALDRAAALAERMKADLVLANDPDADRLAVMARDESGALGLLTGNEVGVLLGHYLLTQQRVERPLVVTTIVSSGQLSAIARATGARYGETLTGFKWMADFALAERARGAHVVLGYEESLGYMVGEVVHDKDGIGAALVVADMAAWCRARGTTLFGYREEIQRAHGLFVAGQHGATLPGASGAAVIERVMAAFRADPPERFGELAVTAIRDYLAQVRIEGGARTPLALPRANVLAFELQGGCRVTLRPSGTEPKIKFYVEIRDAMGAGEPMARARARADARLGALDAAVRALARARGLP